MKCSLVVEYGVLVAGMCKSFVRSCFGLDFRLFSS